MKNKGKAYLAAVLVLWLLGLSNQESKAQLLTVTPHDLLPEQKIMVEGESIPQWKALWDEARKSALQGNFEEALRQYKALLVLKSNLEEARWELARVFIYKKNWEDAVDLLEVLLETSPDNIMYINALGKVMWEMEQYERAVDLFKKVYEKKPSDKTALAGLVEGLTKLGRQKEALPYLEQLTELEPTNRGVRRYLAFLLYETGDYEKARAHLTILSRNEDVTVEVLHKTAKTYEQLKLDQRASTYWERILGREPGNVEAHIFLARYYEKIGQLDRSLSHFQAVLVQNPENREASRRLAEINEAKEEKRSGQTVIRPQPPADEQGQMEQPAENISKLVTTGRYKEAVPLYRQLIKSAPEDQAVLAALAHDLIVSGESEGHDFMLEFLADISPHNLPLYRSMAVLMREMAREEELLAVLGRIHELDPDDNFTTQELAISHLNRGEFSLSRKYFQELSDSGCLNIRCLEARSSLAEELNFPAQRLKDYETLLEMQPGRNELRLQAIDIAAQLGLLDKALFHAGFLQNLAAVAENLELKIHLAEAYRESGYLTRALAHYRNILEQTAGENEAGLEQLRIRSWFGLVDSYNKFGLEYEAEQALREALVSEESRIPFLAGLFRLFLASGRIAESDIWLQAIIQDIDEGQHDKATQVNLAWFKEYLQAEMYEATGDYYLAVDLYKQAESRLPEQENSNAALYDRDNAAPGLRIQMRLALNLLQTKQYEEAGKIILGLENRFTEMPELLVILEQIYRDWGKAAKAESIAGEIRAYGAEDFGRQLILVKLYDRYNKVARQVETAEKAARMEEESLAAKQQLVAAQVKQGKYSAALELLDQFLRNYPENTLFLSRQAELLAKLGNFPEALAVTDMILAENQDRLDIVLLQSRILWEMNRWKDSVSRYEKILSFPIENILVQRMKEQALAVKLTPEKNTWWDKITFSEGTVLNISDVIMTPNKAVDFSKEALTVNKVAAAHYALFRWQEKFRKELSVRRSVMRREYYHAANKLEKVIEEFGANDFLLYDLAGLYSKLDRLGDEANIYRELEAQNESFPGLSESRQRNNLKRRPQVYLATFLLDDDGWEGYKAVRQEMIKGGWKYYRTTNEKWDLDITRINYESTNDDQDLTSWRTMVTYDLKLSQTLGLALGAGFEKLGGTYDDTPLLYGSVTGKIADEMRAVFSVKQEAVTDTIASLKRNIKKRDYKVEFLFDLFPHLLLGGYFDYMNFSDSNWTNSYSFWASLLLLPEPNLMKIGYNYDFYDSHEGSKPGPAAEDGFAVDDHPYWSPLNYWITRFTFYFKHQLSDDALARGVPSYYTIEYSLGYDTENNDLHELKGSFNFEIAKNYTISASYGYLDLDVYQHEEIILSVMYRF